MVDYNYVAVAYLKNAQAQRVDDEQDEEDYVVHLPEQNYLQIRSFLRQERICVGILEIKAVILNKMRYNRWRNRTV